MEGFEDAAMLASGHMHELGSWAFDATGASRNESHMALVLWGTS